MSRSMKIKPFLLGSGDLNLDDIVVALGECPNEGEGIHFAIYGGAMKFRNLGYEADEAIDMLYIWTRTKTEPFREEIEAAVAKAYDTDPGDYVRKAKVEPNVGRVLELYYQYGGYRSLLEWLGDPPHITSAEFITKLYTKYQKICVSENPYGTCIKTRDEWLADLSPDVCLMVPNGD